MDKSTATQTTKKAGRPPLSRTRPARLPESTLQMLESLAGTMNSLRPAGTPTMTAGRLAGEIITRYAADYVAAWGQQATQRTQEALRGPLLPPPAYRTPSQPNAPQSAPQALPELPGKGEVR